MTDDLLALLRAAGAEGISSTPNAIDGMRYQTKANALCAEAAAEIERLRAERDAALENASLAACQCDEWHTACQKLERLNSDQRTDLGTLKRRIATLEAALRPFAEKARWFQVTDGPSFPAAFVMQISVSVGDLSAARAALPDAAAPDPGPDE